MSSFAQDSSHGRLNPGRLPAAAGISLRPRLLLLAGGWAAGVASAYYYDRTLGMRKVTSASQTTTKTSPKGLQPDQRGAAEVQAASTHVIARQDPTPTTPPQTGAAAVWRGVFDPGTNPAATRQGRSFYDTAEAADALTTWQQVLRSEEMRRYNFMDLDRNNDGFLEHDDLRRAFGEGGSRSYLHYRHRALHPNPSTSNPNPEFITTKGPHKLGAL
mmetsp:Transcript_37935/g.94293  ORF Transcript_37935/g.94293 Transcript_37935/m.94293 type:complete len:216 (-) Transcript_37935:1250-1897(-)